MSGARLWILNGILALVVVGAAVGIVVGLTASAAPADTGLRTVPVGRGTVTESVTAAGTVTSARSATLNFSGSGRIASIAVALGDPVSRGQVVATLDGTYAQANLDAAQAQLTAARRQLSDAIDARDNPAPAATAAAGAGSGAATGTGAGGVGAGSAPSGPGSGTGAATPAHPGTGTGSVGTPGASPPAGGSTSWLAGGGPSLVEQQTTTSPTPSGGRSGSAAGAGSSAQAAVDSAQASVAQARAQVIQAQQGLDNLDLVSPQDGTVTSLDATVGQVVGGQGIVTSSTTTGNPSGGALPNGSAVSAGAAGAAAAGAGGASGSGGGAATGAGSGSPVTAAPAAPAVMTVADLASLQVKASVPELDVARVGTGLPARITVNALPGRTLPGSVASVDVLPASGTSVQYGTAVAFAAAPPGLRPGMSASVSIAVRSAGDTALLPSVAVSPVGGPGSGVATVQVLGPDGQTGMRRIGVGITSDTTTQVTSGLAPGELVVLPDPATTTTFRRGGPPGTQGGGQSGTGGG